MNVWYFSLLSFFKNGFVRQEKKSIFASEIEKQAFHSPKFK